MIWLILGLVLFLGVHSVSIFALDWRNRQFAARGEAAWKGIYTVASLVGFGLIVYGYGVARQAPVVLYSPPAFLRHITLLLMLALKNTIGVRVSIEEEQIGLDLAQHSETAYHPGV